MPLYLRLGSGARLQRDEEGLVIERGADMIAFAYPVDEVALAVDAIAGAGLEFDCWAKSLAGVGPEVSVRSCAGQMLDLLNEHGLLELWLCADYGEVAHLHGLTNDFRLSSRRIARSAVPWSKFAICRDSGQDLVFESPLSNGRVVLHDRAFVAVMGNLTGAGFEARDSAEILAQAGMLDDSDERIAACDQRLATWEFHDLYFHTRSRAGRSGARIGATYRNRDVVDAEPALKTPPAGERVGLPKPTGEVIAAPMVQALACRRSRRAFGEIPITLSELSEFLYYSCRIVSVAEQGKDFIARRPYPCAGAAYELEIYPVVQSCRGLEPGIYFYDALAHELRRVATANPHSERLLDFASAATGKKSPPQVLLVYTARFRRIAWKYETIAYAAILKDVGVLMQTMYLVSEAQGLAGCAIGAGDSDEFARATGCDYYAEGSVGEFLIGSRAPKDE